MTYTIANHEGVGLYIVPQRGISRGSDIVVTLDMIIQLKCVKLI